MLQFDKVTEMDKQINIFSKILLTNKSNFTERK